jgi:hypothetical protein
MVLRSTTRRSAMAGGLRRWLTSWTKVLVVSPLLESTVTRVVNGLIHRTPTALVAVASGSRSVAAGDVGWRLWAVIKPLNLNCRGFDQGTGLDGRVYPLLEARLANIACATSLESVELPTG